MSSCPMRQTTTTTKIVANRSLNPKVCPLPRPIPSSHQKMSICSVHPKEQRLSTTQTTSISQRRSGDELEQMAPTSPFILPIPNPSSRRKSTHLIHPNELHGRTILTTSIRPSRNGDVLRQLTPMFSFIRCLQKTSLILRPRLRL